MGMQSIKCPNCGASIEIDETRETCFCTYCGSQIQRDPSNTVTHRTVDVAKIREIEANERIEKERREERKSNDKSLNYILIGCVAFIIFGFVVLFGLERSEKKELEQERQRLNSIVAEIEQDVANENYDAAFIKASGLHMADGTGSKDEQEQWDRQREELIKLIKQKRGDPVEEPSPTQTEAVNTTTAKEDSKKKNKVEEKSNVSEESEVSQNSDTVKAPGDQYDFMLSNYKDVQKDFETAGFKNIKTTPVYDIFWGITEEGSIDTVTIDGKHSFNEGDTFKKDAEVIITYHMKIEDDPSYSAESNDSSEEESREEVHNYTRIDIDVLEKALDDNPAAAKADYNNQYLEIVGRVGSIDSDLKYISLLSTTDSWDINGVHCSIKNEATKEKVKTLKRDQVVAVRGKITNVGEILGYYFDIQEIIT